MIESYLGLIDDKENFVLSGSEDGFLFGWNTDTGSISIKKDLRKFCSHSKDQDYVGMGGGGEIIFYIYGRVNNLNYNFYFSQVRPNG